MHQQKELNAYVQLLDELKSKNMEVMCIFAMDKDDMSHFCLVPSQYYMSIVKDAAVKKGTDVKPEAVAGSMRTLLMTSLSSMEFVGLTQIKLIDPFKPKDN